MSEQANGNKSITLFFLEDDRQMVEHLQDIIGHAEIDMGSGFKTAWSATNLADTEYRLECDPGIDEFTHFLFDIDVGYYKTRHGSVTVHYGERTGYAGLDYILYAYENESNPVFRDMMKAGHVAIFTGHSIEFLKNSKEISEREVYCCLQDRCITKLGRDPSGDILKWLKGEK